MPNAVRSGLTLCSECCVAMAAGSLAGGRSGENDEPPNHPYPPCCAKIAVEPSTANQAQRKAASPNETSRDLSAESHAVEPKSHEVVDWPRHKPVVALRHQPV